MTTFDAGGSARRPSMFERLPAVYRDPERFRPRLVDAAGVAAADAWITGDHMLEEGVSDGRVAALQQALAATRHDPGPADGVFGPRTTDAVRAFQRQRGLVVDGVIGPQTMGEMTAPFLRRFLQGLEGMVLPVEQALDNLHAYTSVATAPAAFLEWLAWIVGADVVEGWDRRRRRDAVSGALSLHRARGTVPGVAAAVAVHLGLAPDTVAVADGGETSWAMDPDAELDPVPALAVRVTLPEGLDVEDHELARLERVVTESLPVGFGVELVVRGPGETPS